MVDESADTGWELNHGCLAICLEVMLLDDRHSPLQLDDALAENVDGGLPTREVVECVL